MVCLLMRTAKTLKPPLKTTFMKISLLLEKKNLSEEAGKTAVKCSKILARITRGSSFLHPFKQILNPNPDDPDDIRITKPCFMKNFPELVLDLSSDTNLHSLSQLAPIRLASHGINLN